MSSLRDLIPRGPVYWEENGQADLTSNYQKLMEEWREVALREAAAFRDSNPELRNVPKIIKFLSGNHWDQFGHRPSYKSKASINKVALMRANHLALLTDTRPALHIRAPVQYEDIAVMLQAILEHEWREQNMELELMNVVDASAIYGTAFWKISAFAPGVIKVRTFAPTSVMPIQPGHDLQDSVGVLHQQRVNLQRAIMRYRHIPAIRARLERLEVLESAGYSIPNEKPPTGIDDLSWSLMDPSIRTIATGVFAASTSGDPSARHPFGTVERLEFYIDDPSVNESDRPVLVKAPYLGLNEHNWWYWVQPGERLYPRKRLIIYIRDVLVYDGPSPYWHGLYPFACLRLNPVFWSFWGLSKYRDLIEINRVMNEVVAGIMDMVKRSLNPPAVARGASVPFNTWKSFYPDMPGSKLYLPGVMANPAQDVKLMDPPILPPYVFQMLVQFLGPEFEKMAGIIDINRISGKMQVPGGDTLEQMRDSLQTPLRREYRLLEAFLRDVGVQAVSHVFQFYSKEQKLRKIGAAGVTKFDFSGSRETQGPEGESQMDFWRQFSVQIEPGSMHGGSRDRRKLMMISLFKMGAISRERLLRELDVDDVRDEEFYAERAMMAQANAAGGGGGNVAGAPLRLTRGQRNGEPV